MRHLIVILLFISPMASAQITIDIVQDSAVSKYHIGSYSYHDEFIGHPGYGAPQILTADGGGAAFGDGDEGTMLVKLDKTGKQQWKQIIKPIGDDLESQSVVEGKNGNFYVFQLVYDNTKYRGGCERVLCLNKSGIVVWDKYIGSFSLINNPIISYIKSLPDGRIYLRGHVVIKAPPAGKDPEYHFWEGWLNSEGALTQKAGEVIDWENPEWQKRFKPE